MKVDHKERAFEANIEHWMEEHGWESLAPDGFDPKMGLYPAELLTFVRGTQATDWNKLVDIVGGEPAAENEFLSRVDKWIANEGTVAALRKRVIVRGIDFWLMFRAPAHSLNTDAALLYDSNRLAVIRQLKYDANTDHELDLALFLNGIPVVTAELKNPLTHQSVKDAIKQYRRDRDPANLTLSRCVVHFAVDPNEVYMTTRLARDKTWFLPFNRGSLPDGSGGAGNYDDDGGSYKTSYLWRDVWQRDSLLNILAQYIHVEGKKTIFPRYHQLDVVRRLLHDAKSNGAGSQYLIQHSAGSGKSNSIAWLSHGLSNLHNSDDALVFDKIVVVTDRVVLDQQLQDTVYQFEHKHGVIEKIDKGKTSADLLAALQGAEARIVITTMQKFPFVLEHLNKEGNALADGRKYAVIVDEAHSSQSGDTAAALKQVLGTAVDTPETPTEAADGDEAMEAWANAQEAHEKAMADSGADNSVDAIAAMLQARGRQPNMSFFAFTATPKARTLELFGKLGKDEKYHPFHLYSMRQAIEEGFILDVLSGYTTYDTYYRLQNAEHIADAEADKGKASAQLARFASLHPYALSQKAEVIVEHFRTHVRHRLSGQAKAMVVTSSRLHAVRYKQSIDAYIMSKNYSDLKTLVAFSGEVEDPDSHEKFTEPGMNSFGEKELPKKFDSAEYQVLIVAEKYQTGFDQPLLVAMYVDKRLHGVSAVQTLSRLNRMHKGKDKVFVLDFVNTADEIEEAFKPFFAETIAEPTDPNLIFNIYERLWKANVLRDEEVQQFAKVLYGSSGEKDHDKLYVLTSPSVDRFNYLEEEEQIAFRDAAKTYQRAYSFLSQVVTWIQPKQEALYVYVKALLPQIPPPGTSPTGIDLSSVELSHFKIEKTGEHTIELNPDGTPLPGFTGDGTGGKQDEVLETVAEIIRRFNERHGLDLTDADQVLMVDHPIKRLLEDDKVRSQAEQNDLDTFSLVAKDDLDKVWLETRDRSEDLFLKVMTHPDMRESLTKLILKSVHEQAQAENI